MDKSFSTYRVRNNESESESELYENSDSNSGDLPLHREGKLRSIDFVEDDSLNEDSFNESVKSKYHSTVLLPNEDEVVPPSDEDEEDISGGNCNSSEQMKSAKQIVGTSGILVDSSPENSPVLVRRLVKHHNRIIDSDSEDDLSIENVIRKSVTGSDNSAYSCLLYTSRCV